MRARILSGGPLNLSGTDDSDTILVMVNQNDLVVTINGASTTYTLSDTTVLSISAWAANDTIIVDADVLLPMQILGGTGNDTIVGGSGPDTISGNAGADSITGAVGRDLLYGNRGNDTLLGGAGRDGLIGGRDNDALYGEAGADALWGNTGYDQLFGGWGNDWLYDRDGLLGIIDGGDGSDRAQADALPTDDLNGIEQLVA